MKDDAVEPGLDRLATESPNPRTTDLDQLDTLALVQRINAEDAAVIEAVRACASEIAAAVDAAVITLRAGGGVHYFGAGTSGRLGVLDASEIPPTFGAPAHYFVGHIAGGDHALRNAVEGAEDSDSAGAATVQAAVEHPMDLVIGLSASGRTPFAMGALREGKARGHRTVAITCNAQTAMHEVADIVIAPEVGPEVLTGSTRLKSGTAQKLVLNMISTGAMVRLGATYGNLMVGVTPTNAKLRDRAIRLVQKITGQHDGVREALEASGFEVRVACLMIRCKLSAEDAQQRLQSAEGSLRRALDAHLDG